MLHGLGAQLTPVEAPFDPSMVPMDTVTSTTTMTNGSGADRLEPAALYRLMAWLSPAYPVGALF